MNVCLLKTAKQNQYNNKNYICSIQLCHQRQRSQIAVFRLNIAIICSKMCWHNSKINKNQQNIFTYWVTNLIMCLNELKTRKNLPLINDLLNYCTFLKILSWVSVYKINQYFFKKEFSTSKTPSSPFNLF